MKSTMIALGVSVEELIVVWLDTMVFSLYLYRYNILCKLQLIIIIFHEIKMVLL